MQISISTTLPSGTAINTALDTARTETETVIGDRSICRTKSGRSTPSVDEQRESYVREAIEMLGIQFPNLLGPEITLVRATNLWQFRNTSMELLAKVEALQDQLTDAVDKCREHLPQVY